MQPEKRIGSNQVENKTNEDALLDLPCGNALRQQIEADLEGLHELSPDEMMPQLLSVLLNWRRKILLTPKGDV